MMEKMNSRPSDFSFRYKWREGTVPPPYHYEYTISAGPTSAGRIDFLPDYPEYNPPTWTETFDLDNDALDNLYALMLNKNMFEKNWTVIEDGRVGGPLEWMEVTAAGKKFLVPSVIEEAAILSQVYDAVKALVPEGIWAALMAKREQFQRSYLEDQH